MAYTELPGFVMIETSRLKERVKVLAEKEKEAWANINYLVGAREVLENLIAELEGGGMTAPPTPAQPYEWMKENDPNSEQETSA